MNAKRARRLPLIALLLTIITFSLSFVVAFGGLGVLPARDLRGLGRTVITNCYNPWNKTLTSYSLNAVSAVIWDYRGIDTIFETIVLFAAITGLTMIFKDVKEMVLGRRGGLSLVTRTSVKLIVVLTVVASASITIHGHLTPGGGFQGGSVLAVVTSLIIVTYSIEVLYTSKITLNTLLRMRYIALLILIFVAVLPVIQGLIIGVQAYFIQNSAKDDSPISMPINFFNTPLGGSIFFFNLAEYIAVVASLSIVVLMFSMRVRELGLEG